MQSYFWIRFTRRDVRRFHISCYTVAMNIIGIVSEYNPFHAGHLYHIEQTKSICPDSAVVAVMSGYFVQRGEPAILSKWDRARVAVKNGVNLVIELPALFATSAAPDFARGAMSLLQKIGATHFSFGSEIADPDRLIALSEYTKTDAFRSRLREQLDLGHSYSAASIRAGAPMLPNAILAAEYIKHAGYIKPILIPRKPNHSSIALTNPSMPNPFQPNPFLPEDGERAQAARQPDETDIPFFPSAKAIRNALETSHSNRSLIARIEELSGISYGEECREYGEARQAYGEACESSRTPYNKMRDSVLRFPVWNSNSKNALNSILLYAIRTTPAERLEKIRGMSEGFENRLKNAASEATNIDELILRCATRRFPHARIRRMLMSILLAIPKDIPDDIGYLRVLAFDARGRALLAGLKKMNPNIIAKLSKSQYKSPLLELDKRASSVYATLMGADDIEHRILPYRKDMRRF